MKQHKAMYEKLAQYVTVDTEETIDNVKGLTQKEEKEFYKKKNDEYASFSKWFLKEHYDMELNIPVKINGRLKKALGRFVHTVYGDSGHTEANEVSLSKQLVRYHTEEEIYKVLIHELIHYALFELDKPFKDGDEYFENELKKHNSISTRQLTRKAPRNKVKFLTHECQDCGMTVERRKDMTKSYRCRCGGYLLITNIREI